MLVQAIHRYRTLLGKCDLGLGLDWDEIDQVSIIEAAFESNDKRRKFRREKVELHALLRGDRINDRIDVIELGPGGLVIRNAPFVSRGEEVELVIDDGDRSFRFSAVGVWLREDGDDFRVGLRFIGMSVCLHKVQISEHAADVVDRIPAAA
jgi:PilZ domain